MKAILAILGLALSVLPLSQALACTMVPPSVDNPITPQDYRDWAKGAIQNYDSVVKVLALSGGNEPQFVVIQQYKGEREPLDFFSMPVQSGSMCGPGQLKAFQLYVLTLNNDTEIISVIVPHDVEELAVREGIWSVQASVDPWLLSAGIAVFLILLFMLWRALRRTLRRKLSE